nr:menaquinone biosynthesis protein [Dissulfurirhabdus thermomarina]
MVNFINTAPIYLPWKEMGEDPRFEVTEAPPTRLNRLLAEGRLDVGLVSAFAYAQLHARTAIFPDLGISATGPVGSVILYSRVPVEELDGRTIRLTPHSATSVHLLRILLEDILGLRPRYVTGELPPPHLRDPSMGAYLAIGDEALRLAADPDPWIRLDLADIWRRRTGLPFVFAVWAVRKEAWRRDPEAVRALYRRLRSCLRAGRAALGRISRAVAPRIPMSPEACLDYLRGIELDLDAAKRRGLRHFFRRLHALGALPEVPALELLPLPGDDAAEAPPAVRSLAS